MEVENEQWCKSTESIFRHEDAYDELSLTDFISPEKLPGKKLRKYLSRKGIVNEEGTICREDLILLFRQHVVRLPQQESKPTLQPVQQLIGESLTGGKYHTKDNIQLNDDTKSANLSKTNTAEIIR